MSGRFLGDMGADVIKAEGDRFRRVDGDIAPGHSAYFFGQTGASAP